MIPKRISIALVSVNGWVLGIVEKWEGEMVLKSAPMEGHITIRTMPLYWRKERGHWRLGVKLTSLEKM